MLQVRRRFLFANQNQNLVKVPNPKVYVDRALLGDRALLNSEKGWQKSLFILNGMQTHTTQHRPTPKSIK